MKVIIKEYDVVVTSDLGTVEVGNLPKGIGLERIRWDGNNIIDLNNLKSFWVENKDGGFKLHCIKVPGSQLVNMKYKDRKKLWNDNGIYKIKLDDQIQTELNLQYRRSHYKPISDQLDIILKHLETKTDLTDELQSLISDWRGVKEKYPKVLKK